ncbi:hypothetical protein NQ315_009559 [Exocentrus adspersus]|uniref:Transcriptional regulator ATRX homolog n=1 Tax=Exocentrus adspersus TaxID=1586481 RepID=A0AAV8WGM6_9CUCU|nr:hypothetical protein NQ315_009559 [Exocentrus adspersus]
MSKEEIVFSRVLGQFSKIIEIIDDTKEIEDFLVQLKLDKKEGLETVLDKAKSLVDSLYDHSVKIKEDFYKHYNSLKQTSNENEVHENLAEGKGEKKIENGDHTKNTPVDTEHNESSAEDEGGKENEEDNNLNNLPEDPLKCTDTIDTSVTGKDENKENTGLAESLDKNLVDLRIIQILEKNNGKENREDTSALKEPLKNKIHSKTNQPLNTEDDSDLLSKAKTGKDSKPSEDLSDSDLDEEVCKKRSRNKMRHKNKDKEKAVEVIEDSDCDVGNSCDDEDGNHKRKSYRIQDKEESRQIHKIELRKKFYATRVKLTKAEAERRRNVTYEISSDSEFETTTRNKQSGKKKSTERRLSDISSLSKDEWDATANLRKNRIESTSSNAPTDESNLIPLINVDDEKLKWQVYILLPKIECSRLKEVYRENKEIFEPKRLTNPSPPKKRKQKKYKAAKMDKPKSSSDEKSESKKQKAAEEKVSLDNDMETSDDEPLTKLLECKDTNKVNSSANKEVSECVVDEDLAHLAAIAVEKLKASDEKAKTSSDKSESETEIADKAVEMDKETIADPEEKSSEDERNVTDMSPVEKSDEENMKEDKEKSPADKEEDKKEAETGSDSDAQKTRKDKDADEIVTVRIDSTDSEVELKKISKLKKSLRKAVVLSDSDDSDKNEKKNSNNDKSEEENPKSEDEKPELSNKNPTRKRIRNARDSSSSGEEDKSTRKNIRRVIGQDALSESTKKAEAEEKERKARIAEKQKKYNKLFEGITESKLDKLILDYDEEEKKEIISVNKKIVKKLKPHQASGIQFMWDACFESLERTKNTKGSGCILAHCMGLGKTLQVIALSHTLLTNSDTTEVRKVLVVCPLNTVLNWKSEFKKWLPRDSELEVHELVSCRQNYERQYKVKEWHEDGGVLIIGYQMFRNLTNPDNKKLSKKMRNVFCEGLVDPGPDLVVCDEGHLLKNEKTHLSISMNRIKTARRIVLTGTPLQNNLKEYWCMVQFIKPNLLGTYKEYLNRFVNPITNGQYTDSTQRDILVMRKRSHVLHKLLDGVVQRKDYAVLEPYLPPKYEYVLFIKLTETQVKLYKHYMERYARQGDGSNRTSFLFADFQQLQRICTHPRVLLEKSSEKREKDYDTESEGSLKDFIDDGDESSAQSSDNSSESGSSDSEGCVKKGKSKKTGKQQRVRLTRAQAAQKYCDGEELNNINHSGKLFLFFQILKECEEIGDKILVFSQSLYTLNCIEYFLEKIDEATQNGTTEKVGGHSGSWCIGQDYFRIDGSSSCDNRASWCNMFNNPDNTRARLFLISTKAGGLGINLIAANRVIIFDVSWNPSHDIQSIYRVYRFGQTKPCYIYRFVSYGTMEMKIYERQVTKQAISKRVIDEQQIDRHYNQNDLQELYKCDLEPDERPIPMVPKDVLLGEMLQKYENTIFKYHLHQSLLENKEDEGLNEEERKAAWEEFENEKVLRKTTGIGFAPNARINAQAIETALANIVRKDNPTWSEVQIKGIIPALVQQLQVQLSEGDMSMYTRVQEEIQQMQEIQAQKLREVYYQQQFMRMLQKQQQQAKLMGNMFINPNQFGRPQAGFSNMFPGNMNQGGPSTAARSLSNDVIELND